MTFALMQKSLWESIIPTSPIEVYTSVLAVATIGLWIFTWRMARSARDTVKSFVEVEQPDLLLTLESFKYSNVLVDFDVVANNLGRSALLIMSSGTAWRDSSDVKQIKGWLANVPPKIVPAAGNATLLRIQTNPEKLAVKKYLWLILIIKWPLRGYVMRRHCFEIAAGPNTLFGQHYEERYADEEERSEPYRQARSRWQFWKR